MTYEFTLREILQAAILNLGDTGKIPAGKLWAANVNAPYPGATLENTTVRFDEEQP